MDHVDRRDSLLAALVALIWGINFLVIDWGMVGVPPLLFLAFRFVAVALPAVFLVRRPQVSWRILAVVGLTMSLGQFSLLYLALDRGMPPGLAGLVLQAQVVFTVVLSTAALREVPTRQQVLGVLLGSSGLAIIAAGRGGSVPLLALVLTLLAALSWATGNVVVRAAKVSGGLSVTVWSAVVVPVPALALALAVDGGSGVADGLAAFGWEAALSTAYTAVLASLVGYAIFNSLLARWPAAAVVPWILLVPVVSMSAAWVILGDTPAPGEVAGGVVMLAGLVVALRPVTAAPRGREPAGSLPVPQP
jgi:O-acetylserine/cysteine efflux transporter